MVLRINENETLPAWMACDAIISKMRDELLSQAVSVMHEQIDKKRISLEGTLPAMSEEGGEREKDAFLLSQIVKEHAKIERQFGEYIAQAKVGKGSLKRVDDLQRFLLELRQIVMLSDYSKECESWMADVEKEMKERDPARILAKTMAREPEKRRGVLDLVIKDKLLARDRVFSESERKIMMDALGVG